MKLGCSYFGNRILKHARTDMQELIDMGCTYVVHTYNENDMLFCHAAMCDMIAMTRQLGLDVQIDPWGVGKVFGGESFSNFVMQNTDALQMVSDGRPAGAACPNHPKFRAFMREWIDAACETEAQTIFWDEPHFYSPQWLGGRANTWGCCCGVCRAKFEETRNAPFPSEHNEALSSFKEDCVYEFLAEMLAYTHSKGRINALCVLPNRTSEHGTGNWERMASLPHLKVFGTDPYWYLFKQDMESFVGRATRDIVRLCAERGLDSQMWVQGFRVPGGREGEIVDAVELMVREGARDIAVWGFDSCRHVSWIRPDNPDLSWAKVKEAFGRVRAVAD